MSSTGDARRSQSAIALSFSKKQGESSSQRSKRSREQMEDQTPTIMVSQASTATITNETVNTNPNLLSPFSTQTQYHNTDGLAIKLNRLKEKSARYTSHKEFLSQCIDNKLVPQGLSLTLEPTIGNYDQTFIDNWYSKLKDFSLNLMGDVVSFCDKTISETNNKIEQTETLLKQHLEKKEYDEIQKTITANEASTKKLLHQRKFKKYNNLKYKSKTPIKAKTTEGDETSDKPSYAEVLRKTRSPIRQNTTNDSQSKNKPDIHQRLRSMSPNNKQRKQGINPSRAASKTNNTNNDKQQQKIKELEEEIIKLKTTQNATINATNNNQKETPVLQNSNFTNNNQIEAPALQSSKNKNMASAANRGQQENIDLLKVITFVEQTMKTLSNYGEQLKIQLDCNLTQQGM